jgi:hypothetical protein
MMTLQAELESAALRADDPDAPLRHPIVPEIPPIIEMEVSDPAGQVPRATTLTLRGSSTRRCHAEMPVDLMCEGTSMHELQMRQSRCITLLSISSQATRALLRLF